VVNVDVLTGNWKEKNGLLVHNVNFLFLETTMENRNIFLMNVQDTIGNVTRVTEIPSLGSGPSTIETLNTIGHIGQF